jgi:hypothetical protein
VEEGFEEMGAALPMPDDLEWGHAVPWGNGFVVGERSGQVMHLVRFGPTG